MKNNHNNSKAQLCSLSSLSKTRIKRKTRPLERNDKRVQDPIIWLHLIFKNTN